MRIHDEILRQDAPDVEWIRYTGDEGWIAFAADEAIVRRAVERREVIDAGARILVARSAQALLP